MSDVRHEDGRTERVTASPCHEHTAEVALVKFGTIFLPELSFGLMAELQLPGVATSRLSLTAAK